MLVHCILKVTMHNFSAAVKCSEPDYVSQSLEITPHALMSDYINGIVWMESFNLILR